MLWRKMLRDLGENKAAYLACIVVMSIGLMVYTSMSMVMDNLQGAKDRFYTDKRFADGFARVKGLPSSQINRFAQIKGIAAIEGRLIKDVRVLMPGRLDSIYLRLVSLQRSKADYINGVELLQGRPLEETKQNILISPGFFSANKLNLGDKITVIIEGKKIDLTIQGTAQSPEFIYALRTGQDMYPDPEIFGIAYVPLDTMNALFRERDLVNDLVFTLEPGFSYKDMEERLEPQLEKYGLETIYPRKDQVSNLILTQELVGLKAQSRTLPVIFLMVAAVILYIMLKRLVEQQRGQIGILKAFGYSGREIIFHYLSYALLTGLAGGLVGGLLGIWLSFPMTAMYLKFFEIPNLKSEFSLTYLLLGISLSVGFSLFAGFQGSKGALGLKPAEAMRPPAPPSAQKTLLEKVTWFWNSLTVQGKMATRNLFRNKQRSFFTFLGVLFTFIMMAISWYFSSMSSVMVDEQFTKVQTYDVKMSFAAPVTVKDLKRELASFRGMKRVEPMLEVPATLKYKWHKKDVVINGIQRDTSLYNILDKEGNKIFPPAEGLLLSNRLAELLGASIGSTVTLESLWSKDSPQTVEVVGIIPQYLGINAYMEQGALTKFLGQEQIATSALLALEKTSIPVLKEKYDEAKGVASVDDRQEFVDKYHKLMDSYAYMTWILVVFALIAGFAVVYNSSIISLSERKREMAYLRVLGMTPVEVLQVITFEQWLISLTAMLAGVPLTMSLIQAVAKAVNTDLYSLPVYFEPYSYLQALAGTAIAIGVAQWNLARKIRQLSLVEVLKDRD